MKSKLLVYFAVFSMAGCSLAYPAMAAGSEHSTSRIQVPTRDERAATYRELLFGWCIQRLAGRAMVPVSADPLKDWIKVEGPGAIGIPLSPEARVEPYGRMVIDQAGGSCLIHGVDLDSETLGMKLRRELLSPPFSGRVKEEEIGPEGHFSEQRVDLSGGESLVFVIMDPPPGSAGAGMLTAQVVLSRRPQRAIAAN